MSRSRNAQPSPAGKTKSPKTLKRAHEAVDKDESVLNKSFTRQECDQLQVNASLAQGHAIITFASYWKLTLKGNPAHFDYEGKRRRVQNALNKASESMNEYHQAEESFLEEESLRSISTGASDTESTDSEPSMKKKKFTRKSAAKKNH